MSKTQQESKQDQISNEVSFNPNAKTRNEAPFDSNMQQYDMGSSKLKYSSHNVHEEE